MGRLHDLVAQRFGGPIDAFYNRNGSTVGTTATQVLKIDADRLGAYIVNLSAAKITIAPFQAVNVTTGIIIAPNGGQLVLTFDEEFLTTGYEWWAIASKANSRIFVAEMVAQSKL